MIEEPTTRASDKIPPALWCLLCLLRQHLEATGTFYRKYATGPWRVRFDLEVPELGLQCFAFTISEQEEVVSAVQNLIEGWRLDAKGKADQWRVTAHIGWKKSKLYLLSILGRTWGERRQFSRMLDWAWEANHLDSLLFVLDRAGEIRGWR